MLISQLHLVHAKGQKDPSLGVHGMVVFAVGDQLIASHLPLVNSKHAHQVLLAMRLDSPQHENVLKLTSMQKLITLEPEIFSLTALRQGTLTSFEGRLVDGHFERGGKTLFNPITIHVEEILLDQHVHAHPHAGANGSYYFVPVSKGHGLLIHRIGKLPSFDQIVSVIDRRSVKRNQVSTLKLNKGIPLTRANATLYLESQQLQLNTLHYLEFEDFLQ